MISIWKAYGIWNNSEESLSMPPENSSRGQFAFYAGWRACEENSKKEVETLADAIVEAAIKRGIINNDINGLTGPTIMHLVDCLGENPPFNAPLSDEDILEEDMLQEAYFKNDENGSHFIFTTEASLLNFVRAIITKQESK